MGSLVGGPSMVGGLGPGPHALPLNPACTPHCSGQNEQPHKHMRGRRGASWVHAAERAIKNAPATASVGLYT